MNHKKKKLPIKGQNIIEFAVIIPALLVLLLCSVQLVFLINAHVAVKFAAYNAARSLIVNINRLNSEDITEKMKKSAALSLIEVSPSFSLLDFPKDRSAGKTLRTLTALSGLSLLSKASSLKTPQRYLYADKFTKVSLESPDNYAIIKRGTPVKIKVEYSFNLNIPIAKDIFYGFIKDDSKRLLPMLSGSSKTIQIKKTVIMQSEN